MFTIFHLLNLVFVLSGLTYGFHVGCHYGFVYGLTGAVVGGCLGFVAGKFPFALSSWLIFRQFRKRTAAQLWSDLQDDNHLMPNMVLRELNRRGEPVSKGLDLVLVMLESEDRPERLRGFAAFLSTFPDLVEKLPGYRPDMTDSERREAVNDLRSSLADTNSNF